MSTHSEALIEIIKTFPEKGEAPPSEALLASIAASLASIADSLEVRLAYRKWDGVPAHHPGVKP